MSKDKIQTRKKILDAFARFLTQEGAEEIGVNAIAHEAGIDKVLIYRYFGNFQGLLQAYSEDASLWPSNNDLIGEELRSRHSPNLNEVLSQFLQNQLKELRRRKATQEIMRWELIQRNMLTDALDVCRDKQMAELINKLSINFDISQDSDLEAMLALFNAGMTYMVLRSKTADKHLGIDLHSNFGWKRLESIMSVLLNLYMENLEIDKKKNANPQSK